MGKIKRLLKKPGKIVLVLFILLLIGYYFSTVDRIEFYKKHHKKVQFINKISNILFLPFSVGPSQIDRYDLIISNENLEFLNNNLPPLYEGNILDDVYRQTVKAQFKSGDSNHEVKVRFRGDTDTHWRDDKKSWLIDFKKNDYFENKEEFHLIIPSDRNYLLEELSFYRARKMGLVVPETNFVNLFVNGKRQGVYWLVEGWSKDFLERQNLPGDTNLYGGLDFRERINNDMDAFDPVYSWKKYSQDLVTALDNYADLNLLISLVNNKSDEYFNENIDNLLDLDNFYKWLTNQILLFSNHQYGSNMRFYFDITKGKFSFIPWDISINKTSLPPLVEQKYNKLITRILKNPEFLHQRNIFLWDYISDSKNLEDDLSFYDGLDKRTKIDFYRDYKKVESTIAYRKRVNNIRDQIIEKVNYLKANLENANATINIETGDNNSQAKITVQTSGFSSIIIERLEIDKDDCNGTIRLWQDLNNNNTFDKLDNELKILNCSEGLYSGDGINFMVYSKKIVDGEFLKPGINQDSFFITLSQPINQEIFTDSKLNLTIKNAVTGNIIELK